MSLSIFCVAQFIRAFGPPESGAASENGLLIAASVLAAIIGKVLCLASATPDVVQRPLICSITADLVAFGAVIASSTRSGTENSEWIVLSFGQAEPLSFCVGVTLFVLTVKRIDAEFDESAVEAQSRRLVIRRIAAFQTLVAAT
jgi:hypothetical protein